MKPSVATETIKKKQSGSVPPRAPPGHKHRSRVSNVLDYKVRGEVGF